MRVDPNEPVKEYQRIDYSQRMIFLFLEGNIKAINYAFYWGHTPQGNDYWYSIYLGRAQIAEEGLSYLRWLTREPCGPDFKKHPYRDITYSKYDTEDPRGFYSP